jgi:hypothetical protein
MSVGGAGGGFIGDGGVASSPAGLWTFDDCTSFRTDLADSSGSGHTAFRSVSTACIPGMINQGVGIDQDDDLVYVPTNPTSPSRTVSPSLLGSSRPS